MLHQADLSIHVIDFLKDVSENDFIGADEVLLLVVITQLIRDFSYANISLFDFSKL